MITVELTREEAEAAAGAFLFMSDKTGGRATARGGVEARTWDKITAALQAYDARPELGPEDFERVELWDADRRHNVAFQGRRVAGDRDVDVYVTPNGGVVVSVPMAVSGGLNIYESFGEYAGSLDMERAEAHAQLAAVAGALGEEYTEELGI